MSDYEDQVRPEEDDTEGHGSVNVNETVEEDEAEDDTEGHGVGSGNNVNETVEEDEAVAEVDAAKK